MRPNKDTDNWIDSPRVRPFQPSIEETEELRIYLKDKIIGQDTAVDRVCDLFLSRSFREKDEDRPFLSCLLNGRSWTGKTMLFRSVADFYQQQHEERKMRWSIPYYMISLSGYHACEVGTMISWVSSGWGENGSKLSKMEDIYTEVCKKDPVFKRAILVFDEIDKVIVSQNNNSVTAFEKISEVFEVAHPETKRADAPRLDLTNFIFCVTANFFTNEIIEPRNYIWFSDDAPVSPEEKAKQEKQIALELNRTDPEEVIKKIHSLLSISTVNRLDSVIIFEDVVNADIRTKFVRDELTALYQSIEGWYNKQKGCQPLGEWAMECTSDSDTTSDTTSDTISDTTIHTIIEEVLENANQHGGFRAIRRYIRNFVKPRIIKELLQKYPLIIPKDTEKEKEKEKEKENTRKCTSSIVTPKAEEYTPSENDWARDIPF